MYLHWQLTPCFQWACTNVFFLFFNLSTDVLKVFPIVEKKSWVKRLKTYMNLTWLVSPMHVLILFGFIWSSGPVTYLAEKKGAVIWNQVTPQNQEWQRPYFRKRQLSVKCTKCIFFSYKGAKTLNYDSLNL